MKTMETIGANYFGTFSHTREGCRGIVVCGGAILLSREVNTDYWLIPGGGMEAGETPEECCTREVREETGVLVEPVEKFLTLHEYYEDWRYTSHYFTCEVIGSGAQALTEQERERGLIPRWIPLEKALSIFRKHADYAATNEEKRGAYLREYTALLEYCKMYNSAAQDKAQE